MIMEYAGKDATKAFFNVGHSTEAQGYMKGATIGELIEVIDKKISRLLAYYLHIFCSMCVI